MTFIGVVLGALIFAAGAYLGWRARDAVKVSQGEAPANLTITTYKSNPESYVEAWDTDVSDTD